MNNVKTSGRFVFQKLRRVIMIVLFRPARFYMIFTFFVM